MKKALLASAAIAALGLAASSQANVVATAVSAGTPASSASASAPGYTGYVIHLASDTGIITAFDLDSSQPNSTITLPNGNTTGPFTVQNGLTGPMVQRWGSSAGDGSGAPGDFSYYDTPSVTGTARNSTNNVANYDSHLLPPGNSNALYVGAINFRESIGTGATAGGDGDTTAPFPKNSDSFGYAISGSNGFLGGAAGIDPSVQASTYDIAYVVLPSSYTGQTIDGIQNVIGFASIATAGGTFEIPITLSVPEPVSASMLGLAAMGLVARRRRA